MNPGYVFLGIGIILLCFSSVTHITDSTIKAAAWVFLNLVMRIGALLCLLLGSILTLVSCIMS